MALESFGRWWTARLDAQFKSVPEGWLFAAPNPWLFGPRRNYILSEAQKAQALAIQKRATLFGFVIGLLVVTVVLGTARAILPPMFKWPALVVATLLMSMVTNRLLLGRLRPVLEDARPTTQKLGWAFQLNAIASFYPVWVWTTLCVVCAIIVLVCSSGMVLWSASAVTGWTPPPDWAVSNSDLIKLTAVWLFAVPLTIGCFFVRRVASGLRPSAQGQA